ncbi:MAG: hypothetical protein H7Y88_03220 [Phycisphaerales bacterium]|nr:hypothetical protein [Phycisphaerales bacterium]
MHVGPIEFERPVWLILIPVLVAAAVWMARQSLSGLGSRTRRVALFIRLLVITLLACVMARPSWREEATNVAVTAIVDASRSIPLGLQGQAEAYLAAAAQGAKPGDDMGRVATGRDALVQMLPGPPGAVTDKQQVPDREATNLAEGVRLSMAVMPPDKANRIVIASDGNETDGSLMVAAEAARAAGVPIDVLPLRYTNEREVVMERLIAPASARMGQPVNLRVLLNATKATQGRLSLLMGGEPVDLDSDGSGVAQLVQLDAGVNPLTVPVMLARAGPQRFEAIFEPVPGDDGNVGDTIEQNNRALAVTFVSGEGRVLLVTENTEDSSHLAAVLDEARIGTDVMAPSEVPSELVDLSLYDAVVLVNVPSYSFSRQQQENLRAYVHDLGGGLVMTGGPESFGAGGWIGSPLADALPVKLDPPQKRQMPRGALVLIMHSCEMPEGNYWGKKTALAAIDNLSSQDLAGVVEYKWDAGGDAWAHELEQINDGGSHRRAINNLSFGDAPSFASMMQLAIGPLEKAAAGQKHAIIISDGDPSPPSQALLQRYINAKVSISTVMVFPHSEGGGYETVMRNIATATGGNFYKITTAGKLKSLPDIFIKEAQTVKRSLIWEGSPFSPTVSGLSDPMRGMLSGVPPISGYVVTAEREGLSQVTLRGVENDPILASWQYGLGKSVAFTSDAATRWAPDWVSWGKYRAFWEQHVRWAMRPGGSADIRVSTVDKGDTTAIVVEALEPTGERLDFVRFQGRVVNPDGSASPVELRQTGPGRYEGQIESSKQGSYVVSLRYDAPPAMGPDGAAAPEGTPARTGVVQAAVSRPFADEYRALKDNYALLEQVAKKTGGRVLGADATQADLFSRTGLTMPVALAPIWLQLAMIAIGVFLMDVAVRRVRIDIPGMIAAARRAASRRKLEAAGKQMGGLQEARKRAREEMEERGQPSVVGGGRGGAGRGSSAEFETVSLGEPVMAGAKFEASDDELARAAKAGIRAVEAVRPAARKAMGDAAEGAGGMNRLLKAKQRAREGLEQEGGGQAGGAGGQGGG